MCEIQFVKRLDGKKLDREDIDNFSWLMKCGVISGNKDAWGVFNSQFTFKDKGFYNPLALNKKELLKDNFIVGHNRWKTSGSEENNLNNHPFELGDFLMCHNGVINNDDILKEEFKFNSDIETDSFVVLWVLNHYFMKEKGKTRVDKVRNAIKNTFKKLNGSISIFLFDKVDKNLYYFKNSQTHFNFIIVDKKVLVGSTSKLNLLYAYEGCEIEGYELKDNKIYLINEKGIERIGKLKNRGVEYSWGMGGYCGLNDYDSLNYDWDEGGIKINKDDIVGTEDYLSGFFADVFGYTPKFYVTKDGFVNIYKDAYVEKNIHHLTKNYDEEKDIIKVRLDSVDCAIQDYYG